MRAQLPGPGRRAGTPRPPGARAFALRLAALAAALAALSSCAYYNTYYLARKYYYRGTSGEPYSVEGPSQANASQFNKAIDYSKKVLAQYPKSKWVDDAYLMWARSLLGRDDPIQTVNMLQDFTTRFPKSPLGSEAMFYLGVANRQARRYADALTALDEFLRRAPRHALAPHAYLERARTLVALERPAEAAEAATRLLERYPKSPLVPRALALRAEARLANGDYELARADFHALGTRALSDEERLGFLLREADCIEAARQYEKELALLRDALSHEHEPVAPDTTGGKPAVGPTTPAAQHWGRLMLRVGSAQLLAGRVPDALSAYERVVHAYPKTELGAEAQYRQGFAYETAAEDFDKARDQYRKVRDHLASGPSFNLASERLGNLDRLAQYRKAGGDSLQKGAEADFLLAELYLFTHDKPERALEEYRRIAKTYRGTPYAAKAMNAEAWVLSRKLDRKAEAESLFWRVVREYPATDEQLAARDYLEIAGQKVPDKLIKRPAPKPPPKPAPRDTLGQAPAPRDTLPKAPAPQAPAVLGPAVRPPLVAGPDSLRLGIRHPGVGLQVPAGPVPFPVPPPTRSAGDSGATRDTATARRVAPPDTAARRAPVLPAARDTAPARPRFGLPRPTPAPWTVARDTARSIARADSVRRPAARDTGRSAARPDTARRAMVRDTVRSIARADSVRRPAMRDTARRAMVRDTSRSAARPDTAHRVAAKRAPRDTAHAARPDTTRRRTGKPARRDTTHSGARPDTAAPAPARDTRE
ncbi:MAG TPA: tetratricopeptide repeat protein [Candidatus Eisenbacteria bacterium]|jgi:TolA-binding protein